MINPNVSRIAICAAAVAFALLVNPCGSRLYGSNTPVLGGLRTVALSIDSFPGVPEAVTIEQFGFPRVDAFGRVAFKARLLRNVGGVSFNNDTAIWAEIRPGALRYVAREGDPVPGLNYRFNEVEPGEDVKMSAGGNVFFLAGLTSTSDPPSGSSGIFRFSPRAGLEPLVVSNPVAVDVPTVPGGFSNFMDFNEVGDITMQADHGFGPIWFLDSGGGLSQVVPEGSFPSLNDAGDVAYRVIGDNFVRRIEVWNRTAASPRTVAVEGAVAPGTNGARFLRVGDERSFTLVNGPVTFVGRLQGAGVSEANDFGIWTEITPGGPLELELREGQRAPGTEDGVVWSDFTQFALPTTFGRSGGVALRLNLDGPNISLANNAGVWAGMTASELHLVARKGDPAPGTEPGVFFSQFDKAGVTVDGRGVFQAFLSGSGLDPNRDRGIWAEGTDGALHLVARRGDFVQLPSGELTQLASIEFNPKLGISEHGHITFVSNLSNGQRGVFVSSTVAVPEPFMLLQAPICLAFVATMLVRRRRR